MEILVLTAIAIGIIGLGMSLVMALTIFIGGAKAGEDFEDEVL